MNKKSREKGEKCLFFHNPDECRLMGGCCVFTHSQGTIPVGDKCWDLEQHRQRSKLLEVKV